MSASRNSLERKTLLVLAGTLCWSLSISAAAQSNSDDPVLATMRQEMNRSLENLKKTSQPPYFLSYQLADNRAIQISGAFGALLNSNEERTRLLDIDLRVGDYALDNTHAIRGGDYSFPDWGSSSSGGRSRWTITRKRYAWRCGTRLT